MDRGARVGAIVAAGVILLVFAGPLAYAFWPDVRDYVAPQHFTPERWEQAEYLNLDNGLYRWRMRHSLMRQHELAGMTRGEVERLLGPGVGGSDLVYGLGPASRGIDFGTLELRLDSAGIVSSYEFRRH